MFYLAVFFLLAAGAAHWAANREAQKHGETVLARRWETSVFYRDEEFIGWVTSGSASVDGYRSVLAPYDLALLACLGAALAAGSLAAAESLQCVDGGRWVLCVAPVAFSAADFVEDRLLLARMAARSATPAEVQKLRRATLGKFLALAAAVNQTVALALWAFFA
ncbi:MULTISPECIES: hypothetical protein [Methylocystis]|uniref:DUF1772 domain-containing protein n=1 Tax=Methylocystis iwaonis TaxID=2885079 RepID=A0ABM8E664_9HYPH|nr:MULTISPECIES: hypothetical protein [Methylocystis]MDJ0450508.1 hypothetical protein [Methylocystis sp. JR02]BDV33461.1 hypothetical protein SS37A_09900 [Methylocystis iwaonis]